MKRSILNAQQSAFLAATFDRNRSLYGGFRMEVEPTPEEKAAADRAAADAKAAGDKPNDKADAKADADHLGDAGKKALDAERDARKAAEDQVKSLKGEFDGFKTALTEALGIKPKEGDGTQDALTAVQQQLAAMQRESSVLKLANEHKITDAKDVELLATAKDADSMKSLAERLAPKEDPERDAKSRQRPKPDKGQGGSGGSGSPKSVNQLMDERRAAREARSNTTS